MEAALGFPSYETEPGPFPQWLYQVPIAELDSVGWVREFLPSAGIRTIGEVIDLGDRVPAGANGAYTEGVHRLRRRVDALVRLGAFEANHPPASENLAGLLNLPSTLLDRVLRASSVGQELDALAEGLSSRDRSLFLTRLYSGGRSPPSLGDLAARWGISGERVRQVIQGRADLLAGSGLRLPISCRLIHALERQGGLVSSEELLQTAEANGIEVEPASLFGLLFVTRLGLLPSLSYDPEIDSWSTDAGKERWVASGGLAKRVSELRQIAYGSVQSISCVDDQELAESCVLSRPQRIQALVGGWGLMREIEGFLIPHPIVPSKLTRSVEKMLAASPTLLLTDVAEGLVRVKRELGRVPPPSVLEHILVHHPSFQVEGGRVHAARAFERDQALSAAEKALLSVLSAESGAVPYRTLLDGMEAHGFSSNTGSVLALKSPFLRRVAPGLYAVRGDVVVRGNGPEESPERL